MWSLTHCGHNLQPHTTRLDHHTLKLLKNWTWQFVVIRPVCSILMITLQYFEIYPTWVSWINTIVLNISVSLALYSLVVFYHVFAKELAPHKPLAKFLCIKGIVFFCFWQVFSYALPWSLEPWFIDNYIRFHCRILMVLLSHSFIQVKYSILVWYFNLSLLIVF